MTELAFTTVQKDGGMLGCTFPALRNGVFLCRVIRAIGIPGTVRFPTRKEFVQRECRRGMQFEQARAAP